MVYSDAQSATIHCSSPHLVAAFLNEDSLASGRRGLAPLEWEPVSPFYVSAFAQERSGIVFAPPGPSAFHLRRREPVTRKQAGSGRTVARLGTVRRSPRGLGRMPLMAL